MTEPVWVADATVAAIHDRQLALHGGLPGVRDANALGSALGRPRNAFAYGSPDLADLAAAYAFGLACNHPFSDGNKRTAFVVAVTFLGVNGVELTASNDEAVAFMLALAAGELGEAEAADWFRARLG